MLIVVRIECVRVHEGEVAHRHVDHGAQRGPHPLQRDAGRGRRRRQPRLLRPAVVDVGQREHDGITVARQLDWRALRGDGSDSGRRHIFRGGRHDAGQIDATARAAGHELDVPPGLRTRMLMARAVGQFDAYAIAHGDSPYAAVPRDEHRRAATRADRARHSKGAIGIAGRPGRDRAPPADRVVGICEDLEVFALPVDGDAVCRLTRRHMLDSGIADEPESVLRRLAPRERRGLDRPVVECDVEMHRKVDGDGSVRFPRQLVDEV